MRTQEISVLYKYNAWSTARILTAASALPPAAFLAPAPFPHGSLRGTLAHALSAECLWRSRWDTSHPAQPVRPEDFPNLESLRARWAQEGARLMQFVADLTDERLQTWFKYVSTEGFPHERQLWESMLHVINHGTQHKTEAAAILTSYDCSPGDIDLIVYLNDGP